MGKRIISQARGHGSLSYRVRKAAFRHKIKYPIIGHGEAEILAIIHSAGHTAPLLKLKVDKEIFFNPAFNGAFVGQKIQMGKGTEDGSILMLKDAPMGASVYNIERHPGDGGKMMRASGTNAIINKKYEHNNIGVLMPSKKEIILAGDCRVTIGSIAGQGRTLKPFMTAGKMHYKMKTRNKLWPRTSAVKVNAVDHPFGSGRGKRIKSKIAKRNAPPGTRVGHIRPRRTGRRN